MDYRRIMQYVIGTAFAIVVIAFAVLAIRGRVRARNCCTVAPADQDARLR